MTNAKKRAIYWGKPTQAAINELATWDLVILNEANMYSIPNEQPEGHLFASKIKALNSNTNILVSFNFYSTFVDSQGKPSVYFPIHCLIHKAATETNAWLMNNGQHVVASPHTWVFDIRVPAFRYRLAEIWNNALDSYIGVDGAFWDEIHRTIGFLPNPVGLPTEAEWTAATKSLLRMIDKPMMGNGNYDISANHKTKSRGRYIQNATSQLDTLTLIKSDLELPISHRWTTINPTGAIVKSDWAKLAWSTGTGVQYYPNGVTKYDQYNIEQLSF